MFKYDFWTNSDSFIIVIMWYKSTPTTSILLVFSSSIPVIYSWFLCLCKVKSKFWQLLTQKKEFQNISCGRLIFWSYQPHETIRAAAGGSSTDSVTYMRYAKIKMRATGIKIRKLKNNAAPAGLFFGGGAIDFLS